jgi:hypothetical protein
MASSQGGPDAAGRIAVLGVMEIAAHGWGTQQAPNISCTFYMYPQPSICFKALQRKRTNQDIRISILLFGP